MSKATQSDSKDDHSSESARRGPAPVFSHKEETEIVQWALRKMNQNLVVRKRDIVNYVQQYLMEKNQPNPFTDNRPGRSWINLFFKRHPEFADTFKKKKLRRESSSRDDDDSELGSDTDVADSNVQGDEEGAWVIESNDSNSSKGDDSSDDLKMDITEYSNSESEGKPVNESTCNEMFLDDDDVEFLGYTLESTKFVPKVENLNIIQKELDELDLASLPDNWWYGDKRSISISSIDSSEVGSHADISTPANIPSNGSRLRSASSNPAFRKPFDYGFRREIVYRGVVDGGANTRRLADVYYYCPDGRKMRSIRDVSDYLDERIEDIKLTLGNFTFLKEPIGINDSTKEIVRDARKPVYSPKQKKTTTSISKEPAATAGKQHASPSNIRPPVPVSKQSAVQASRQPAVPVNQQPAISASKQPTVPASKKPATPPIKRPASPQHTGKMQNKTRAVTMPVQAVVPRTVAVSKDLGINKLKPIPTRREVPVSSQSPQSDGSIINTSRSLKPPCSITCIQASGLIPTLQCALCLCLYHPVCVGLPVSTSEHLTGYICPNCRQDKDKGVDMTQHEISSADVHPHPQHVSQGSLLQQLPLLQQMTTMENPSATLMGGKVVYTMGNWRPPPLPPLQATTTTQPWSEHVPQQSLALMNGKKYVVIPRNNIAAAGTSPDEEISKTVAPPLTMLGPQQPQMTMLAQQPPPQMHLLTPANAPQFSSSVLPKGSFLINQPGSPGNMFLLRPADGQNGAGPLPQFMLLNPMGPSSTSRLGETSANLCLIPKLPEEAASTKSTETTRPQKPTPMKGTYTFTETLTAHYAALLGVLGFLTIQELQRAACVCRTWRSVANDPSLWTAARMKNSQIKNWKGCMTKLAKQGTNHLDLRKTLLPKREEEAQATWQQFCSALKESPAAQNLCRIDLCRCPADVVATVAECCSQLRLLSATAITVKGDYLDLKSISMLEKLQGLRLKSFHGMTLENFQLLKNLKNLTQLSLTSIRILSAVDVAMALSETTNLELLELGDCPGLLTHSKLMSGAISSLQKLRRLRLEKLVTDNSSEPGAVCSLLEALSSVSSLVHLELVNIEASPGSDHVLAKMTSLQHLLLVPSYISHGARTCQLLLKGVLQLKKLERVVWVVTNEVIGVTKKMIRTKHNIGQSSLDESQDSIPVLTPLPGDTDISSQQSEHNTNIKPDQLEILPLYKLQVILRTCLPKTHVAINRVTFQSTWRQVLSDWDLSY